MIKKINLSVLLLVLTVFFQAQAQTCGDGCVCIGNYCDSCMNNYYLQLINSGEKRVCVSCGDACVTCTQNGCTTCKSGFYSGRVGKSATLKQCNACGRYCNECVEFKCTSCQSGYKWDDSLLECKKNNLALIIGLSVGGFVLIVIIIVVIACYKKRVNAGLVGRNNKLIISTQTNVIVGNQSNTAGFNQFGGGFQAQPPHPQQFGGGFNAQPPHPQQFGGLFQTAPPQQFGGGFQPVGMQQQYGGNDFKPRY